MSVATFFVDIHRALLAVVAAASRHCQGRTRDQDKSTHSRPPIIAICSGHLRRKIARIIV